MYSPVNGLSILDARRIGYTSLYRLHTPSLSNRYYILSHPDSRSLMAYPEVVGYPAYEALLPSTTAAMQFLLDEGLEPRIDILTILRGGLNYPIEEACNRCDTRIKVRDIHFLSCERKIETQWAGGVPYRVITGLEIKYEKIRPNRGSVLAIGDILATGDTFRYCLDHFLKVFRDGGGSLRRLVFFTIGGTRAVEIMEDYSARLKEWFPGFEGIDCFFFEGMFTVYDDSGVSGINTANIDFGWKGGAVSPDFRSFVLSKPPYVLLEKCIIYDGGARRYEIPVHFEEVLEYWEGILDRAQTIDCVALVGEKLGYPGPLDFETWKEVTHLKEVAYPGLEELWKGDTSLFEEAVKWDLKEIALEKIASIKTIQSYYR